MPAAFLRTPRALVWPPARSQLGQRSLASPTMLVVNQHSLSDAGISRKAVARWASDMELEPRPVDIPVQRPIGESYGTKDSQLDAAVRELLRQVDESKTRRAAGPTLPREQR